jgi:3-oxoacyl-[acyl-carrier protein] reductase
LKRSGHGRNKSGAKYDKGNNLTEKTSKVAIVTGASRGIGAAVAERLATDGFTVVVNYSGDARPADALAAKIESGGGRALAIKADVGSAAAVQAMFDHAEKTLGGIDVLVNNAGIMKLAKVADSDEAMFDQQIAVNLKGSFNTMREAARRLRDGGRIVNFSTSVVGTRLETYGVYTATKAAVEAVTAILAKELRGRNITVNAVAPGPVATDLFLIGKSPELIERMAKMNPMERLGTPEDIASVVAFLVGPDGDWINGQVLRANGGMV